MNTHLPQKASDFEAIYWPDGSCGVYDGTADCHQPGFEQIYSVVEDKREEGGAS